MSSHRHHKGHHKVLSPWRLIFFTMFIFNESLENYLYDVTQYWSRSDKEIIPFAIQYNTIQNHLFFNHKIQNINKNIQRDGAFLIRIFPYLDWTRRFSLYISVFSPNAGKYRLEKLRIRTLFVQCKLVGFFARAIPWCRTYLINFFVLSFLLVVLNKIL